MKATEQGVAGTSKSFRRRETVAMGKETNARCGLGHEKKRVHKTMGTCYLN